MQPPPIAHRRGTFCERRSCIRRLKIRLVVVVVVIRTSSKSCKDGFFTLLVEVKSKKMYIDFKGACSAIVLLVSYFV